MQMIDHNEAMSFEYDPDRILLDSGEMYSDYINKIKNTYNFRYYMPSVIAVKGINYDIDRFIIISNIVRLKYAALLELFIEDETPEMFCIIFEKYLDALACNKTDVIFRDGLGNSIFHYDAAQATHRKNAYEVIESAFNSNHITKISILNDINTKGITVLGVINSNIWYN